MCVVDGFTRNLKPFLLQGISNQFIPLFYQRFESRQTNGTKAVHLINIATNTLVSCSFVRNYLSGETEEEIYTSGLSIVSFLINRLLIHQVNRIKWFLFSSNLLLYKRILHCFSGLLLKFMISTNIAQWFFRTIQKQCCCL